MSLLSFIFRSWGLNLKDHVYYHAFMIALGEKCISERTSQKTPDAMFE